MNTLLPTPKLQHILLYERIVVVVIVWYQCFREVSFRHSVREKVSKVLSHENLEVYFHVICNLETQQLTYKLLMRREYLLRAAPLYSGKWPGTLLSL